MKQLIPSAAFSWTTAGDAKFWDDNQAPGARRQRLLFAPSLFHAAHLCALALRAPGAARRRSRQRLGVSPAARPDRAGAPRPGVLGVHPPAVRLQPSLRRDVGDHTRSGISRPFCRCAIVGLARASPLCLQSSRAWEALKARTLTVWQPPYFTELGACPPLSPYLLVCLSVCVPRWPPRLHRSPAIARTWEASFSCPPFQLLPSR
jgi:hypothetical protein